MTESELLRALAAQFGDQPFGDTGLTVRGAVAAVLGDGPAAKSRSHRSDNRRRMRPEDGTRWDAVRRRIVELMQAMEVTNDDVARMGGVSRGAISHNLRGRGAMGEGVLERFAKALGTTVEALDPDRNKTDRPGTW